MVFNRICRKCGRNYYACSNCIAINSWKNICCSRECYRKYVASDGALIPKEIKVVNNMSAILLRAVLKNEKTISITGYDLELGKFDCTDGYTRVFEDFDCFIIPTNEMKEISSRLFEKVEEEKTEVKSETKSFKNKKDTAKTENDIEN